MSRCPIASAAVAWAQASIGFADPGAEWIGRGGAAAGHPRTHPARDPSWRAQQPPPSPRALRAWPTFLLSGRLLGHPGSTRRWTQPPHIEEPTAGAAWRRRGQSTRP